MEVHLQSGQSCKSENNPGTSRRHKEEGQQSQPNRGGPVKHAQYGIRIAKGEKRSNQETQRQHTNTQFDPECRGEFVSHGRKCPGLVEEEMRQEENRLKDCDETN